MSAELDIGWDIRVLHDAPDALIFLRDYVSCSKPVLIKGYAAAWPAVKRWNKEFLVQRLSGKEVRPLAASAAAVQHAVLLGKPHRCCILLIGSPSCSGLHSACQSHTESGLPCGSAGDRGCNPKRQS